MTPRIEWRRYLWCVGVIILGTLATDRLWSSEVDILAGEIKFVTGPDQNGTVEYHRNNGEFFRRERNGRLSQYRADGALIFCIDPNKDYEAIHIFVSPEFIVLSDRDFANLTKGHKDDDPPIAPTPRPDPKPSESNVQDISDSTYVSVGPPSLWWHDRNLFLVLLIFALVALIFYLIVRAQKLNRLRFVGGSGSVVLGSYGDDDPPLKEFPLKTNRSSSELGIPEPAWQDDDLVVDLGRELLAAPKKIERIGSTLDETKRSYEINITRFKLKKPLVATCLEQIGLLQARISKIEETLAQGGLGIVEPSWELELEKLYLQRKACIVRLGGILRTILM